MEYSGKSCAQFRKLYLILSCVNSRQSMFYMAELLSENHCKYKRIYLFVCKQTKEKYHFENIRVLWIYQSIVNKWYKFYCYCLYFKLKLETCGGRCVCCEANHQSWDVEVVEEMVSFLRNHQLWMEYFSDEVVT